MTQPLTILYCGVIMVQPIKASHNDTQCFNKALISVIMVQPIKASHNDATRHPPAPSWSSQSRPHIMMQQGTQLTCVVHPQQSLVSSHLASLPEPRYTTHGYINVVPLTAPSAGFTLIDPDSSSCAGGLETPVQSLPSTASNRPS